MRDDWRKGEVAITGASGQVGTSIRHRLAGRPNPVTALGRGGDWKAAVRSAETVLHLAGTLQPKGRNTYESANVDTSRMVGDVAEVALRAALDPAAPSGTFEVGGPDEMMMDAFVRTLNPNPVRLVHLPRPLARTMAHVVPTLTPALMELLLQDNVTSTDSGDVGRRFGVQLHRVTDVWPS